MIFCTWERESELDFFYVTACKDHKTNNQYYSADGTKLNIKKCPFCSKKILNINEILDKIYNILFFWR